MSFIPAFRLREFPVSRQKRPRKKGLENIRHYTVVYLESSREQLKDSPGADDSPAGRDQLVQLVQVGADGAVGVRRRAEREVLQRVALDVALALLKNVKMTTMFYGGDMEGLLGRTRMSCRPS